MTMPVRLARRLALAAFITVGVLVAGPPMPTVKGDGASDALRLRVKSLAFNIEQADARQVGKLTWRGGLVLSAPQAAFGGWSDLWVAADGSALRAVSDEGNWLVARLVHDRSGQLAGLADPQFGRLKGPDGTALRGKTLGDAESLAMLPDGSLLVGFERRHRILRYPAGDERQPRRHAPSRRGAHGPGAGPGQCRTGGHGSAGRWQPLPAGRGTHREAGQHGGLDWHAASGRADMASVPLRAH
jgi:hypothetical protein